VDPVLASHVGTFPSRAFFAGIDGVAMRAVALAAGVALLLHRAAGEEVTKATWQKEVTDRVDKGQFVFVKFLAPW